MGRFHEFEDARDPHESAIGKSVSDPIDAARPQIDFDSRTRNAFRTPPVNQVSWFCPGGKEFFGRCMDHPSHHKRRGVAVG